VRRKVSLSPDATRQFRALRTYDQRLLREALRAQLQEDDAAQETRNRFRLRRPSEFADFELRVGDLRAFYRVLGDEVLVVLIGEKQGSRLIIEGRGFVL
jgi:mRNA-degrading endonuclease RelE of RelBE toxin-antitoxin system